jgi:hypothetical protein
MRGIPSIFFVAVCPSTGETDAMIVPHVDKFIMTQHLEQISAKTALVRHAVIIMDRPSGCSS